MDCCLTGLAYIDVHALKEDNVRDLFDGKWVVGKRTKTGVVFNVPLLDIPLRIIEKYKGTLKDKKALPTLSNQKTNSYLKEIGELCGINKNLTFHLARHDKRIFSLTTSILTNHSHQQVTI